MSLKSLLDPVAYLLHSLWLLKEIWRFNFWSLT
jgi:hypothetical protein